jgi:hypothetical protein
VGGRAQPGNAPGYDQDERNWPRAAASRPTSDSRRKEAIAVTCNLTPTHSVARISEPRKRPCKRWSGRSVSKPVRFMGSFHGFVSGTNGWPARKPGQCAASGLVGRRRLPTPIRHLPFGCPTAYPAASAPAAPRTGWRTSGSERIRYSASAARPHPPASGTELTGHLEQPLARRDRRPADVRPGRPDHRPASQAAAEPHRRRTESDRTTHAGPVTDARWLAAWGGGAGGVASGAVAAIASARTCPVSAG